jgi:isopropylmalate/homocitrate/citramalate synthase
MAILEGAEVIHTTVTGCGERTGNAPFEETVMSLLTLYGIDTGIKYGKINELASLVAKLTGLTIPANRPLVGETAYNIESGIVANWYKNIYHEKPTLIFPVAPSFVGHHPPQIVLGKKSGVDNIQLWASWLGIELNEDEIKEALAAVKTKAIELKRPLSELEFKDIVTNISVGK